MAQETKKYNEHYLNGLIKKAKKSWEGVDVDSYMNNLRDDSFNKEVAEELSKEVTSYIIEQIKSNMNTVTVKCQALMVGDFCRSGHGLPMQITNVGEDYAYATFEGNEGDPWEFDDKDCPPDPILLTPEILEKNGFKYNDLPYAQEWEQYGLSIYGENPKMINCGLNIAMNVTYVHQLQHALRLCELDELANNFKV